MRPRQIDPRMIDPRIDPRRRGGPDPMEALAGTCALRLAAEHDRIAGIPAAVVATPVSTAQTSDLMRAAHAHGLRVVVRGHGTKQTWSPAPEHVDVILETTGMDELIEHSHGDLIATAGAGIPLARLADQLAAGAHQLVLDDPVAHRDAGSTLGGALATNASGARRLWTGALRDLVIGVRFVRADGTVARAGGKVVKNVAGYDLGKLLTGSFGTLAVVTEVTVRLHPLPDASTWVVARPADHGHDGAWTREALAEVLDLVVHSQLVPHAVELLDDGHGRPAVATLLQGTTAGVEARARALADQLEALGPVGAVDLLEGPETPGTPVAGEPTDTVLKVTCRIGAVPDLVTAARERGLSVHGSAGTGVLYLRAGTDEPDGSVVAALPDLRRLAVAEGGSALILQAAPEVMAATDPWGPVGGLELMRRIKHEFDPTRLLSPGRFVGGL